MHIAAYLGISLALLAAPAFSSTQKYSILQTKVKPGQQGKDAFNNLYVGLFGPTIKGPSYLCLFDANEAANVFILKNSGAGNASTPTLYNLLFNLTNYAFDSTAVMNFGGVKLGLWQDVVAYSDANAVKPGAESNRFYVNGSQLLWYNNTTKELFKSWMVCDYIYGYPQLLFTVKNSFQPFIEHQPLTKGIPSSCALVDLEIIPVP